MKLTDMRLFIQLINRSKINWRRLFGVIYEILDAKTITLYLTLRAGGCRSKKKTNIFFQYFQKLCQFFSVDVFKNSFKEVEVQM